MMLFAWSTLKVLERSIIWEIVGEEAGEFVKWGTRWKEVEGAATSSSDRHRKSTGTQTAICHCQWEQFCGHWDQADSPTESDRTDSTTEPAGTANETSVEACSDDELAIKVVQPEPAMFDFLDWALLLSLPNP